jgi:hypothetical protein
VGVTSGDIEKLAVILIVTVPDKVTEIVLVPDLDPEPEPEPEPEPVPEPEPEPVTVGTRELVTVGATVPAAAVASIHV